MGVVDGVGVGVGVSVTLGVGAVVTVGVGVGVVVVEEPLKTMLGELLLESVTAKLLVVSCIVNVSVPAFCETRLKVATPFCA